MFKFPFLDFDALNEHMNALKIESNQKLSAIYEAMGGEFYDEEKRIMKGAKVALVGVGGLSVQIEQGDYVILGNKVSLENIKQALYKTSGISAGMSYMNPYHKSLTELSETTLSRGHTSILHTLSFNILITGLTIGVEHEFSSQRDIIHLSRLTVAKTTAQRKPCIIVRDKKYLNMYEKILKETDRLIDSSENTKDWENINLLYPTAKASAIMISGSLKNIQKLIALKDSGGKEDEFIDILKEIDKLFTWL